MIPHLQFPMILYLKLDFLEFPLYVPVFIFRIPISLLMTASGGFPVNVGVVLLTDGAWMPAMSSPYSVGYDLYANHPMTVDGYDRCLITTGVCLDIPVCGCFWIFYFEFFIFQLGFYGCVYPRSSLVLYSGITIIPFCLDADSRCGDPPHIVPKSKFFVGGRSKSWF